MKKCYGLIFLPKFWSTFSRLIFAQGYRALKTNEFTFNRLGIKSIHLTTRIAQKNTVDGHF